MKLSLQASRLALHTLGNNTSLQNTMDSSYCPKTRGQPTGNILPPERVPSIRRQQDPPQPSPCLPLSLLSLAESPQTLTAHYDIPEH